MAKLLHLLKWADDNLIKIMLTAFIFAVPLYPKIPFIDLEYTYISIRFDDFFVAIVCFVFLIQLIRQKVTLRKDFLFLFIAFWAVVFISYLSGVYLMKTIPVKNIGFLHAARRVEYMAIFFVALSVVKNYKDFLYYLKALFAVAIIVCIYGLGQKFLGWPAMQTMNPEFALGRVLYLTPEARISSTFAGHYDLAAYLVLLIPMILATFLSRKKLVYFGTYLLALSALALTASRISSIAYAASVISFLVYLRRWVLLVVVVILSATVSLASQNLTARFQKTFQIKQIFINKLTGQVVVPEKISSKELPSGSFYVQLRDQSQPASATSTALLRQRLLDDVRDNARKDGRTLTETEENDLVATASAGLESVNTIVSDISLATRLQVEWPRAVSAFLKNPLLGTGPSSITEATDNDYLRWMGEFGALGTGLFLFILYNIAMRVWKAIPKLPKPERYVYYGFLFGFGGLMINAGYIDVFEASKVAYHFWLVAGLILGSLYSYEKRS